MLVIKHNYCIKFNLMDNRLPIRSALSLPYHEHDQTNIEQLNQVEVG